ncbi:hypothetical protein [Cetobacterium sp.]|uniref:hypothetical protein n=1 Tax=Cetobacterium sp. TaxID=2071632 RepID=UPI003F3E7BC3
MENIYFDEITGEFLNGLTVEKFFRKRIEFDLLFDGLTNMNFPLTSDLTKCFYAFNLRKTYQARVKFYYHV